MSSHNFVFMLILEGKLYFQELKTLEWWISRLMLDPLFFSISRIT